MAHKELKRSIARSNAFRALQKSIGGATSYLNTVAVSLELTVPQPITPPTTLHIPWACPATVQKRRDLVSQTRNFVLRSVMIAACDALDSFIREWASTDWLAFPQSAINIATKATTNSNGREWSVFDRLKTLADVLQVDDVDAYLALVSLGSRWRNALVHMGRARFELDKNVRSILKSPKTKQILGVKAGFDITETIKKFDSAEDPSLKDVTTILAYMQDVCRQLDQAAICRVADTEDKVEVLLKNALKIHFITRGELDEFWGIHRPNEWIGGSATASYAVKECMNTRLPEYQPKWERKFSNLLNSLGFSMSEHPVSHEISSKCVGFLASMSACDFAKEVGL